MESNKKRIAQNSIALYIRMLLKTCISLYTSRVVLDALGIEDYGIYNIVGGIVIALSFLNRSIAASTERFLTFEIGKKDFVQVKKTFSLSVSIHAGIALLIFILAETLGQYFLQNYVNIPIERMDAARKVFHFSVLASIFTILQAPYNAAIIAYERMGVYAYISILEVALNLTIALLLSDITFYRLEWYGALICASSAITATCYILYCRWNFVECRWKFVWDFSLCKKLLAFAGWNICGALAWTGRLQGINIILNFFYGPCLNAAYGISTQINNALGAFVQSFISALNPPIIKKYASGEIIEMEKLIFMGARYSCYLLLLLAVPLLLEMDSILSVWLKEVPEYTTLFTRIAILETIVSAVGTTMLTGIIATGRIKIYQIVMIGLSALNLVCAYVLLSVGLPPFAVLITSVVAALFLFLGRLAILYSLLKISKQHFISETMHLLKNILSVAFLSISLPILLHWLWNEDGLTKSLVIIACSITSVALSAFFIGLTQSERKALWVILGNRISKK